MYMKELIYVTSQPDVSYFHWQSQIYGYNFTKQGIDPKNVHIIFGLVNNNKPSSEAKKLKDFGYNVHFYLDQRDRKHYIPSIKPYLISKWIEEDPTRGELFFLHDSDIVFREKPNYNIFLNDDVCYCSDTKGYISWNYLNSVCHRYESQHLNSEKHQLLKEMCEIVGIDVECIECNQENSGGGQYIIKNTNSDFWYKVYDDSNKLYDQMINYHNRFPINPGGIQFWTAEMWSLLWNLWVSGKETRIIDELGFSWATDSISSYNNKPILHMAGVTEDMKSVKFYKGDYININPLDLLRQDITHFDYLDKNSSTIKYIDIMKEIVLK